MQIDLQDMEGNRAAANREWTGIIHRSSAGCHDGVRVQADDPRCLRQLATKHARRLSLYAARRLSHSRRQHMGRCISFVR